MLNRHLPFENDEWENLFLFYLYITCVCFDHMHIKCICWSFDTTFTFTFFQPPLSSQEICGSISRQAAFDCTSGLVAVQTENYGIQFYSLFANRGLYEVIAWCSSFFLKLLKWTDPPSLKSTKLKGFFTFFFKHFCFSEVKTNFILQLI
jgi:hypothetical protein